MPNFLIPLLTFMFFMYIAEAISMADKVIVLTKRPAQIKRIYDIDFENRQSPMEIRKTQKFFDYYDLIWKDIDKNVE